VNALDRQRKWHFVPLAEAGVEVEGGSFLGEVIESSTVVHKIMVPPNVKVLYSGSLEKVNTRLRNALQRLKCLTGLCKNFN